MTLFARQHARLMLFPNWNRFTEMEQPNVQRRIFMSILGGRVTVDDQSNLKK